MNFYLSEEQTILKDTLHRFLKDRYDPSHVHRRQQQGKPAWRPELWQALADLGLMAIPFAEENGGLGGGPVETMLIAQAFGFHLVTEPYLPTVVVCGTLLRLSASAALRKELIPKIAAGELTAAFAHDEPGLRSPFARRRAAKALKKGSDWLVSGCKTNVIHGASADWLFVTADTEEGTALFIIDPAPSGVQRRSYSNFDGEGAADAKFTSVEIPESRLLAIGTAADELVEQALQHAIAFISAEAAGIMRLLLDLSVSHLKARAQFGQTLSHFQALQHRAADMLIALEQTDSMSLYAAMMTLEASQLERRKAFAAVKAVIGGAARLVGQSAVQLHGGIGVSDEYRAGWGMKRLTMIEMIAGDTDYHAAALAELGGFVCAGVSGAGPATMPAPNLTSTIRSGFHDPQSSAVL